MEDMPQSIVPYSVEGLLEVDEVVEYVSLMLQVLFDQDPYVEDLLYCAPPSSKSCLFFG